jgi:hypothetical protein
MKDTRSIISGLPVPEKTLVGCPGSVARNSSGEPTAIFQGTSALARYSWSNVAVNAKTFHQLQNVLRLEESGIFLYKDPWNSYCPANPLMFGSTWTQGGLFFSALNVLPVQLFGCYGGRGYNMYVRPFLVEKKLNYNGTDYEYDPWTANTTLPTSLVVRPNPLSTTALSALTDFENPLGDPDILPATFEFYTPVTASNFTHNRLKGDQRLSVNFDCTDAHVISLTLTEVSTNTIYPTISAYTAPSTVSGGE